MTTSLLTRCIQFARSVLVLTVMAVGVPVALGRAALARFGSASPMSGLRPNDVTWSAIERLLTERMTERLIADVVIRGALVVCWVAVAVFVLTVIVEAVHMACHDGLHLPDVRGLGLAQRRARVIAVGLLVLLPAIGPRSTAMAIADSAGHTPSSLALDVDRSTSGETSMPLPTTHAVSAASARYVVRSGDSIYAIAERVAGPSPLDIADYADRLIDVNLGRDMGQGKRFTNAAYIDAGWELELPATPGPASSSSAPATIVHLVAPGESLWSIADAELGDGARWPEIYEINRDRTFGDGRLFDDPRIIRPGWELAIPLPAPAESPGSTTAVAPEPSPEAEPEVPTQAQPEVVEAVAPVLDSPTSADQHHDARDVVDLDRRKVRDSPRRSIPAASDNEWLVGHPRWGESVRPADDLVDGATDPSTKPSHRDPAPRRDATAGSIAPELLTMRRAAMLSVGVLILLGCRRRQRMRQAEPRARIPAPTQAQRATERSLRLVGAGDRFARVEIGVRAVALALVNLGERVLSVACSPDGELELTATGRVTLAPPWEQTDVAAGDRWTLPAATPIEQLALDARRVAAPSPTLVQLGVDQRGWDLYVDLEAIGSIEIGGPPEAADTIVRAIGATLAGSVLAEIVHLVSVGLAPATFLGHRLHRAVDDPKVAIDVAVRAVGSTVGVPGSTFELRARVTSGEAWEPAVVLVAAVAGRLLLPASLNGVVVVSAAPIDDAAARLVPDGDLWLLEPAGLRLQPIGLVSEEAMALAELLDVPPAILDDHVASVDRRPDDTIYESDRISMATPEAAQWSLMVRLLGPVSVVDRAGVAVEFERSKTRELVAWLATHRDRSTRINARTALWEQDVRDATFANVVSEARRAMARCLPPPNGDEWLGRTLTDSLPLHRLVVTDADLVEQALSSARQQPPPQAIATLRPVVQSIGGLPFEGTSYLWPDAEGLTSYLILLATTAAAELAAHYLSVGDVGGVFAATGRGLRVLPGHEELIGLRMRAHAGAGDHAGVKQEWESYERMIGADPWSDGEPSPKLVDLRHELLHPSQ